MSFEIPETTWLNIPELVDLLNLSQSQVRRLIEEQELVAIKIDGVTQVPAEFIHDGQPLKEIKGTVSLLSDCGFSDEETIAWMLTEEESLATTPIAALKAGRKSEVRRVAQALL